MIDAAHGNNTRITATIHPASKPDAAAFLALDPAVLTRAAQTAVSMAMRAGYDGVQLDWEGECRCALCGIHTQFLCQQRCLS